MSKQLGRPPKRPLLESEIRLAISKTVSNQAAARYLGVSYFLYKKYADLYGVYELGRWPSHGSTHKPKRRYFLNVTQEAVPIEEILDGFHPTYNRQTLKKRLFLGGYLPEKCDVCGFEERRVGDYKVPVVIDYLDGDRSNYKRENMRALCFNCSFLINGNLTGPKRDYTY